jgi:hypothetical protein
MEELLENIQKAIDDTKARIEITDWKEEFKEMDEDDEYAPLKYYEYTMKDMIEHFDHDGIYNKLKNRWYYLLEAKSPEAKELQKSWMKVDAMLSELRNIEKQALRDAWEKEDIDMRPSLGCASCRFFGYTVRTGLDHECAKEDKSSICDYCKKKCGTYPRLEAHIKSKHQTKYNCKECNFPTNSQAAWDRHLKEKKHKEKCGIERPVYECKVCDKQYYFPSKYKEHLVSPTHIKKVSVEKK